MLSSFLTKNATAFERRSVLLGSNSKKTNRTNGAYPKHEYLDTKLKPSTADHSKPKLKKRVRFETPSKEASTTTTLVSSCDDHEKPSSEAKAQTVSFGTAGGDGGCDERKKGLKVKVLMTKEEAAEFLSKCKEGGVLEFKDVARELVQIPINRVSLVNS